VDLVFVASHIGERNKREIVVEANKKETFKMRLNCYDDL
jgi:hypothetical protein